MNEKIIKKLNIEKKAVMEHIKKLKNFNEILNALKENSEYVTQKIAELVEMGLHIANRDYFIVLYKGKPQFNISYLGMLKVAGQEASRNGFILIPKADALREGYKIESFETVDMIDNILIKNGNHNGEIKTAYSIIALKSKNNLETLIQKVEILPESEYQVIKGLAETQMIWGKFEGEMAKKTVFKRSLKILQTIFYSDILEKLFNFEADDDKQELQALEPNNEELPKLENQADVTVTYAKDVIKEKTGVQR